jgi:hypothetical protein
MLSGTLAGSDLAVPTVSTSVATAAQDCRPSAEGCAWLLGGAFHSPVSASGKTACGKGCAPSVSGATAVVTETRPSPRRKSGSSSTKVSFSATCIPASPVRVRVRFLPPQRAACLTCRGGPLPLWRQSAADDDLHRQRHTKVEFHSYASKGRKDLQCCRLKHRCGAFRRRRVLFCSLFCRL